MNIKLLFFEQIYKKRFINLNLTNVYTYRKCNMYVYCVCVYMNKYMCEMVL